MHYLPLEPTIRKQKKNCNRFRRISVCLSPSRSECTATHFQICLKIKPNKIYFFCQPNETSVKYHKITHNRQCEAGKNGNGDTNNWRRRRRRWKKRTEWIQGVWIEIGMCCVFLGHTFKCKITRNNFNRMFKIEVSIEM